MTDRRWLKLAPNAPDGPRGARHAEERRFLASGIPVRGPFGFGKTWSGPKRLTDGTPAPASFLLLYPAILPTHNKPGPGRGRRA